MKRHLLLPADPPPGPGVFALPHGPAESLMHLLPVPFEATVSYGTGTARGPEAIREASAQVDLLDPDHGRPYRSGIYMHPSPAQVRRWNREARRAAAPVVAVTGETAGSRRLQRAQERVNRIGDALNRWVEKRVGDLLDDGRIVGVLGGDHAVPFGAMRAHARRHPGLGILHFDAHADLRRAYEGFSWSHASIMHNVVHHLPEVARLVQVGVRDFSDEEMEEVRAARGRVVPFLDRALQREKMAGHPFASLASRIVATLPRDVYVSFDVDGLEPALCPHTGTPVPGGLTFQEASAILSALVASGRRILGFDLVEVAPGPTPWDANVGARLLYKLIGATLRTRLCALSFAP